MLIILPYLQLAASHAGCYGLQGRFISKNSLFSYSDDISSRYPGMLKDILSCIRLLTDLRSKIHQYVPCGIPCNAHLETCGFSPALAGVENATAVAVSHDGLKSCGSRMGLSAICFANRDKSPSGASRSTKGALRIFPSFSWNGKCDSRERSESEHRRCVADFPRLQLEWKMRQQGAKRAGATKERCGFSPASAGMENATAGSKASRSDEGALSQRIHELRKATCESSPASAGSELTAQVCWPVIRLCHFGRRNYTTGHHAAGHGSCCARSLPAASLYYAVKGLDPHFGIISAYVLWLSRYLHLYRSNGGGYRPAHRSHPG